MAISFTDHAKSGVPAFTMPNWACPSCGHVHYPSRKARAVMTTQTWTRCVCCSHKVRSADVLSCLRSQPPCGWVTRTA